MAFFKSELIKHDIVQKLSTSFDNLFGCITVTGNNLKNCY